MSTPIANPFTPSSTYGQSSSVPQGPPSLDENPLPTSLYASLLGKLVTILELDSGAATGGKNALLQATNDFKFSLARTKELATRLPGGELTLDEQDEIIQMLEAVRDGKKHQLEHFGSQVETYRIASKAKLSDSFKDIEMDSTASTPAF